MAALPVPETELKQAIISILDSTDHATLTAPILRSKLEEKFNLGEGTLKNHRDIISEWMSNHLKTASKKSTFDDLDSYLDKENIEDEGEDDNNNNKNKNKKSKNPKKSHKKKKKSKHSNNKKNNNNEDGIGIMDINYNAPDNSKSFKIYTDKRGISYSVMLNLTDITYGQQGHNKFYGIQLLEHKRRGLYKFITKWGRVGNKPQMSEMTIDSKQLAIDKFKTKFHDKTKNEFGNKRFLAVKGKYIPIAMNDENDDNNEDEEDEDDDINMDNNNDNDNDDEKHEIPDSTLNSILVRLLKLIFSRQLQYDTAKALDIDLNRLPLGSLSRTQINKGYRFLLEINNELLARLIDSTKIANLTNKFYTAIPHNFGRTRPPIINNTKLLHKKIELIEALKQMIFTNKILKKQSKRKNPIDVHYDALRCNISPLSEFDGEYHNIIKAVKGTHAVTHNRYDLEVIDCFEVDRFGEKFRHLPFRKIFTENKSNCKLLWHGSRLSNFVGILSQGLRIAPAEAPTTGYMFGKGLYFADCASKSANYIHATQDHPYGALILCEVALGNMYPVTKSKYFEKAPNGYHSVKAIGKNIPKYVDENNPEHDTYTANIDDYELSLGPLIKHDDQDIIDNGSLLYNEYIVYDIAQVRMKYIVLTKFNFKQTI